MSFQKDVFNIITRFSGQANTIAVPRVLCQFAGSLEAGTLLSQMLYWSDRGNDPDGWFYKSYVEWQDEVFLTEYQVRKITKQFEEMGFLETKLKKANGAPTLHYRVKKVEFSESILKFLGIQDSENLKNPSSIFQESITKTTTEITTETSSSPSGVGGGAFACWMDNMPGSMTPILQDQLTEWVDTYGEVEVIRAIRAAVENNVRRLTYVRKVLENRAAGADRHPATPPPDESPWRLVTNQFGDGQQYLLNVKTNERRPYVNT